MAAPVGVTSSNGTPREYIGAPRRSSTTAGPGMGSAPCSVLAIPNPVGTGEAKTRSISSIETASAVPTMSTMESTPPTSWNVTSSTSLRCTVASASASRRKIRWALRSASPGMSVAWSSSVRMLEYVRMTPAAGASTWIFVARSPNDSTSSRSSENGSRGSPRSVSRSASKSAPASTSDPSAMSPEMPAMQSK